MKKNSDISVLILAGQREGCEDPLCTLRNTERKALIPILGQPMIDYPLKALRASGFKEPYCISGLGVEHGEGLVHSASGSGPADSATVALESGVDFPVLVTTADHALLTPEIIAEFLTRAQNTGADVCVGLAEEAVIQPAYPHVKRTYLRFKDTAVSGCNLFYVANEKGLEAFRYWRRAQDYRKRPLRLAASIGLVAPILYLTGRLTAAGAFKYLSKRIGINAQYVLIPIAEAAIDVDKPSDLELVETILLGKQKEQAQ